MNFHPLASSLKAKMMGVALLPLIAVILAQPALAITVVVDNAPLQVDPQPLVQNGRVFVPLRGIFEALGASVVYDNGTINATQGETTIALSIGSTAATISGAQQTLDTPPFIVGASTYVPLRFVAQAFGDSVSYDDSTSTVQIVSHDHNTQNYAPAPQAIVEAPPPLPVYFQPPCPFPNAIWVPGYWAWNQQGYYWVPGMWTPAPAQNLVWTPGYWYWNDGLYNFHPGYWAEHVGYYGGVSYGFGYFGHGFVGGGWLGGQFYYNVAIMNVDPERVRTVYVDRHPRPIFNSAMVNTTTMTNVTNVHETMVNNQYISNHYVNTTVNRTSFNGGTNGVQAQPIAAESYAQHETHYAQTPIQQKVKVTAASDRRTFAIVNHGHPVAPIVEHPERLPRHENMPQGQVMHYARPLLPGPHYVPPQHLHSAWHPAHSAPTHSRAHDKKKPEHD